jgi:hypothetical protein
MTISSSQEGTRVLVSRLNGYQEALERLTPLIYGELHTLAHRFMRRESPDQQRAAEMIALDDAINGLAAFDSMTRNTRLSGF